MTVRYLFPTPLVVSEIDPESPLIKALRNCVLEHEATSPTRSLSNQGGWQSSDDFLVWSGQAGQALLAAINQQLFTFTSVWEHGELKNKPLEWKIQIWANVNRTGAGNKIHFHPGAYWSGVFYVDDGGIKGQAELGGALEFVDPRGPIPVLYAPSVSMNIPGCENAGKEERFFPKTGQMVLFPSWLSHLVTPYHGVGARISIAFNCGLW